MHCWVLDFLTIKRKNKGELEFVIKYGEENLVVIKLKMIHCQKFINTYCNWLLIKTIALNNVLHSQEFNNKLVAIGLMAVCDEHIIYQLLHALLSFGLSHNKKKIIKVI